MQHVLVNDINLHFRDEGPRDGAPVVFANSLGTDFRLWDAVVSHLPSDLRIIRYDKRGHGLSDCPPAPYGMGTLVRDIEALLDDLRIRDCVFVGVSIGGMIAQGLAIKRLDLVRAAVLSNTAAKIGTPEIWRNRLDAVRRGGIEAIADPTLERWFSRSFHESPEARIWRNMLTRQPVEGYLGCGAAISGTDFYTPTSGLRLPVLAIAGSEDGSVPPDLVRETASLVPGSRFHLMRGSGHLPMVDAPQSFADALTGFLREIGHI